MINAIEFGDVSKNEYLNDLGGKLTILPGVKHINIFVGENNSGKSRLLRTIIKSDNATILEDKNISDKDLANYRARLKSAFVKIQEKESRIKIHEKHDQLSLSDLYAFYINQFEYYGLKNKQYNYPYSTYIADVETTLSNVRRRFERQNSYSIDTLKKYQRVYIPVLRGVECFNLYFDIKNSKELASISMNSAQREAIEEYKDNARKIYKNKICSVYGVTASAIFTGEDLYVDIRDKLLGKESDRRFVSEFEKFISVHFYNGESFNIIPIINKGYLHVKIGNSEERPLHDLGDGIKQLICILYKAYELKDSESILCIEEPGINLHPGYQRKLLDILQLDVFSKMQFFITTHSNHLIDNCIDSHGIAIYTFINVQKRNSLFQVVNSFPGDIEILNQLGVNNSSVYMSNCTIWVEGLSDKIYISKYLHTYMSDKGLYEYREGIDYSFIEYGGNNVTHWSFYDSDASDLICSSGITNRAFLIVDNDGDSKKARKDKLKSVFDDRFIELPVREIENTIGKKLLEKCLFDSGIQYKNGMESSKKKLEAKGTIIWQYIDEHYVLSKQYWDAGNKHPKINKVEFARMITKRIDSVDDMSDSAIGLCEKLYEYISGVSKAINE